MGTSFRQAASTTSEVAMGSMDIVQYAKLHAKLFLDRRPYRGRSEFAFGFPCSLGAITASR
jgi:hypothetical protein